MQDDFEQKSTAFLSWLTALPGASISPKIKIADYRERGAGRGVKALHDIEKDEDLFTIPHSSVISVDNSDLKSHVPDLLTLAGNSAWLPLILVLIYECLRGEKSLWKPYFDILPTSFNTLMFWSPEELRELQASAVLNKIGKKSADDSFANDMLPVIRRHEDVFGSATLSDDELGRLAHRMASVIMAYGFDLPKEEDDLPEDEWVEEEDVDTSCRTALVPLADMLNADAESNASPFHDQASLTMKALCAIPAGAEILNDYGQLPRSDLLRRYGYITPLYAKYDHVEIDADWLDATLATHQQKYLGRVLTEEENEKRREYLADRVDIDAEDGFEIVWPENSENMDFFPEDLSRYVKVMVADDESGNGTRWKQVASLGSCDEVLLKRFEGVMLEVVTSRLQQYATTLAEDLALLEKDSTQGRLRTAIEVRIGEKQILKQAEVRIRSKHSIEGDEPATKRQRVE